MDHSILRTLIGGINGPRIYTFPDHFCYRAEIRNSSPVPLLKMIQKINIANIIQRLDALFMIWLILNDYFKVTIFMYAAVIGGATIFKVPKNRLIIPSCLITFFISIFFAGSYITHMAQSDIVLKNIYPIFSVYIPLLLCIVNFVRKLVDGS